jgi:hypothetical protein
MLRWDYEPLLDEEPIDGFHVYMDDHLMFDVESDRRSTFIPSQALHPPCGEEYRFHLESFRGSDWSFPSNTVISASEAGDVECRRVRVTFDILTTYELGADDANDPGDVGPVHGSFSANDEVVQFSGVCNHCDGRDIGIFDNVAYAINGPGGLLDTNNWLDTGPAEWVIDVPPGEDLFLGYQVIELDYRGWGYVCVGSVYLDESEFTTSGEGVIPSDLGQGYCEVSYSIQPVDVVSPDPLGVPPLPQLAIENITLSASGDQPVIHFKNTGTGDWAGREIEIRARTHDGDPLGHFVYPEQFIPVGEGVSLVHPRLSPQRPLDLCIELDPYDQVLEHDEAVWHDQPISLYCQPQPDLIVETAYREYGTNHFQVQVWNIGEGLVQGETLGVELRTANGHYYPGTFPWQFEGIELEPWGRTVLEWDAGGMIPAGALDDGYSIILNPSHLIAESDEGNNAYEIPANPQLAFLALGGEFRWYPLHGYDVCEPAESWDSEPQTHTITFALQAWSPFGSRSLGSLTREIEISGVGLNWIGSDGSDQVRFDLDGTEQLLVTVSGEVQRGGITADIGQAVFVPLTPEEGWGVHEIVPRLSDCSALDPIGGGPVYPPEARQHQCGAWYYHYKICQAEQ